jgi:hypothetical protein
MGLDGEKKHGVDNLIRTMQNGRYFISLTDRTITYLHDLRSLLRCFLPSFFGWAVAVLGVVFVSVAVLVVVFVSVVVLEVAVVSACPLSRVVAVVSACFLLEVTVDLHMDSAIFLSASDAASWILIRIAACSRCHASS